MNIEMAKAIDILMEEYRATRREVEQGIADIAKIGSPVVVGISALIGFSSAPLITRLYLSLPLICAVVMWAVALTKRANLWSEHIGLRQAFLEHRINTLAGYNLLLHENNVTEHRKRRGLDGAPGFWTISGIYSALQLGLFWWAFFYDPFLLFPSPLAVDQRQIGELFLLLLGITAMPLAYWVYVHCSYRSSRKRLVESCERFELPLGNLTHCAQPLQQGAAAEDIFCGLELHNNLYQAQLANDREHAKELPPVARPSGARAEAI